MHTVALLTQCGQQIKTAGTGLLVGYCRPEGSPIAEFWLHDGVNPLPSIGRPRG